VIKLDAPSYMEKQKRGSILLLVLTLERIHRVKTHYEYLDTYMDDILIWSKDLMAVIKSLEMNYMLKSLGTLEYCLGGNVEFFGESWKNQAFGLALSAKT
jgi:hypothetical protein